MGVIKQGILGGFSGRIANVVGGSWKGIAYMRSQPLSVANPRTTAQVAQRTKFSFGVLFAKIILAGIIKPLWDRFAQGMSGYNMFMSVNTQYFIDWATTQWANLVMSQGKMSALTGMSTSPTPASTSFTVNWDTTLNDSFAQDTDLISIVVVNTTKQVVDVFQDVAVRSAGTATVTLSATTDVSNDGWAYIMAKRTDGSVVSNSTSQEFGPV